MKYFSALFFALTTLQRVLGGNQYSQIKITPVAKKVEYGNGGHWCSEKNVLYYADTWRGSVYKYDPVTKITRSAYVGKGIATIVPLRDQPNKYLVTSVLSILVVEWDGESDKISSKVELFNVKKQDKTGFRFNCGKADANGVYYSCTFGNITLNAGHGPESIDPGRAAVYQYRKDADQCSVEPVIEGETGSIGLAWNKDNSLLYYVDCASRSIEVFDYDLENAKLCNRRSFFNIYENGFADTKYHLGLPVNVAVSSDDHVWASVYGLGLILEISPDGKLLRRIELPVPIPSMIVWGGVDMKTLYVTSVSILMKPEEYALYPLAGYVFEITGLGSTGIYQGSFEADICLPEPTKSK